jgi:hypothetical protein
MIRHKGFYTLTGTTAASILGFSPLGEAMARLRDLSRIIAAVVLSFGLTAASISSASTPGFGTVVYALHAHVGRAAASVGTTVFSGDSLDTEELGSLQVRSAAARLLLPATSRVTWSTDAGTAAATLKNGTAIFSAANAKSFALYASTATIRANGDAPAVGSVSIVNPRELRVSCSRGSLAISVDDDTKTISEGTAYRVVLDPDQEQQTADGSAQNGWPGKRKEPKKSGKDKFLLFVIFGSALATGIALYYALESPDAP